MFPLLLTLSLFLSWFFFHYYTICCTKYFHFGCHTLVWVRVYVKASLSYKTTKKRTLILNHRDFNFISNGILFVFCIICQVLIFDRQFNFILAGPEEDKKKLKQLNCLVLSNLLLKSLQDFNISIVNIYGSS